MKRRYWLPVMAVVTALVLTACLKNDDDVVQCTPNTLAQDQHVIDSFIMDQGISYLSYSSTYGAYIGIANPGHPDSSMAASDSLVAFKQVVSTFRGSELKTLSTDSIYQNNNGSYIRFSDFQSGSYINYLLTNARKGGSIRLIYPSSANSLGFYGCQQQSLTNGTVIPAYSQVILDITLTGVKKP
ncbi:hypothetical protein ABDK00_013320 [Niabella insulamsoli]|uniref:hypothetical protein n=1 Tax=Niabella insulamsoli TaxID=3144874 RepID=UPI0031FC2E37